MTVYRHCRVDGARSSVNRKACTHRPADGCRWGFVVDLPAGPGGKRRQHREQTFLLEREAKAAQRALLARLDRGEAVDRRRTVGDELLEALAGKRSLKPSTRAGYEGHLRKLPAAGRRRPAPRSAPSGPH